LALEALEQFSSYIPKEIENTPLVARHIPEKAVFEVARFCLVRNLTKIWMNSLKEEADRRGISQKISDRYLRQAYFEDTKLKKRFNGFAFAN
jgi:hypothetical protein